MGPLRWGPQSIFLAFIAAGCGTSTTTADAGCPTCGDPCKSVLCDRPPVGTCTSLTEATTYSTPGTCAGAGNCSYKSTTSPCVAPANGISQCAAGSCVISCNPGFDLVSGSCIKKITAIAAGDEHACAVVNGTVYCWGDNTYGELGNGMTGGGSPTPVAVPNLVGVTAISAGQGSTCAVVAGAVWCWGNNVGTVPMSPSPIPISGLQMGATTVAAGYDHFCAAASGAVKCWGSNDFDELGNNGVMNSMTPVATVGLTSGVVALSAGAKFTCALAGKVPECWGYDGTVGDLGNGNPFNVNMVPMVLSATPDGGPSTLLATAICAGYDHACIIDTDSNVDCWGNNVDGELGLGSGGPAASDVPVAVPKITGATVIAQGSEGKHVCVVAGGDVKCWGDNADGQLGVAATQSDPTPVTVEALRGVVVTELAVGTGFTCAIAAGKVMCWGDNTFGELGNGGTTSTNVPTEVSGL